MRARLLASLVLSAWLSTCQGPEVDHVGSYAFLPNAPVADTDPLPLEHFLVIEQDGVSGKTLFYYFEGTLGAAGIGLSSLERIAGYYAHFGLRFEYPLEHYTSPPRTPGAGGEAGAGALGAPSGAGGQAGLDPAAFGATRKLRVGEHDVPLLALDDASLAPVGATRFLSMLSSGQWKVAAYFGVLGSALELGSIELTSDTGPLHYEPDLEEPGVFEVAHEASAIELLHELVRPADTVELDLLQTLTRTADQASIETSVRAWSEPEASVRYDQELLQSAFDANCWSRERSLYARLRQIARQYTPRHAGDFAVEHRRTSLLELGDDDWHGLVAEPAHPAYCAGYE